MLGGFVLTLKTALSGQTLDQLLAGSCMKSYEVSFEGIEQTPAGERKIVRISFTLKDDRTRFKMQLQRLADAAPRKIAEPQARVRRS